MTITFLPQNRKQKYFLFVLLGLIALAAIGFVWYRFSGKESIQLFSQQQEQPSKQVEIDFTVFEHPVFRELGEPRPPITLPDQVGRTNPFLAPQ